MYTWSLQFCLSFVRKEPWAVHITVGSSSSGLTFKVAILSTTVVKIVVTWWPKHLRTCTCIITLCACARVKWSVCTYMYMFCSHCRCQHEIASTLFVSDSELAKSWPQYASNRLALATSVTNDAFYPCLLTMPPLVNYSVHTCTCTCANLQCTFDYSHHTLCSSINSNIVAKHSILWI